MSVKTIFEKVMEHKTEIGLAISGVLAGAGTVSACIATLKVEDILDEHKDAVEDVKDKYITLEQTSDEGLVITETISDSKAYRKDLTKVYFHTAGKMCRLYAPTALIFGFYAISLGSTYKDIKDLKKRNTELITALIGRDAILARYRDDMRNRLGEEAEQRFYNNIHTEDIETVEKAEDGKEKKHKVKGAEVINGELSGDAFIFDESCDAYVGHDINHNLYIAGLLKNQCSDNLFCNGSLLMFEILDAFGIDRDEVPGAFVRGCLSERKGGKSDTVDMDIRKVWVFDESKEEYVEKILVDPKLDGVIVDRI